MSTLINNPVTITVLFISILLLFGLQIILLLRIRTILQQISFYIESISRFFYRVGIASSPIKNKPQIPKTCQYCKFRLSFIHMSERNGEVEDFYYKCQLRNTEVQLNETCERYEKDERY
ncbi:MAG: hypothetical protein Kow0042_13950 [Calditrichia bacterium]